MMTQSHILIVDDERDICEILRFNLEAEGYVVATAESAEEADIVLTRYIGSSCPIHLIILDVMMPGMSGFEWATRLKANPATSDIPVIFCTAKGTENDTLTGFGLGSDDYIVKPFRVSEVKARVKAVLRRCTPSDTTPSSALLAHEGLTLNIETKVCLLNGQTISLTKTELEILALLLAHPGRVYTREDIIRRVWPQGSMAMDRTVDVNIARLRKKIGPYAVCIRSRSGFGYTFCK